MNILFFSDVHGNKKYVKEIVKKSKKADLLICAGDLSKMGEGFGEVIEELSKIKKRILVIAGNNETPEFVKAGISDYENIILLDDEYYEDDISVIGIGGGTPSPWNTPYELTDSQFKQILSKFKKTPDILLVHSPPKDTILDKTGSGMHIGSFAIGQWIKRYQPKYCCCGHVHEAAGKEIRIGKTLCFNPGPKGRIIKI